MNRELSRELYNKYMKAEDEYYKLRDAKSDGCCHGMSLYEVLAYDNKIIAAAEALHDARESYLASIHA